MAARTSGRRRRRVRRTARPSAPRPAGPRRTPPAGSRTGPLGTFPRPDEGTPRRLLASPITIFPGTDRTAVPLRSRVAPPRPSSGPPAASTRPGHRPRVRARCDGRTIRRARTTSAQPPGPAPGPPGPSPDPRPDVDRTFSATRTPGSPPYDGVFPPPPGHLFRTVALADDARDDDARGGTQDGDETGPVLARRRPAIGRSARVHW